MFPNQMFWFPLYATANRKGGDLYVPMDVSVESFRLMKQQLTEAIAVIDEILEEERPSAPSNVPAPTGITT